MLFLRFVTVSSMIVAPLPTGLTDFEKYYHFTGCLSIKNKNNVLSFFNLLLDCRKTLSFNFVLLSFSMCSCQCTYYLNSTKITLFKFNGDYEIRTRDPLLARQVLSQLS